MVKCLFYFYLTSIKDKATYNTKHYPTHIRVLRSLFPIMERVTPFITNKLAHKFFFFPVEYSYPEIELEWLQQSRADTFCFNKTTLKLYHWGNEQSKNKILLVHGWAGRATQFWKLISKLEKDNFHIISYDAPGHGKSDGETTNLPEMASIINELRVKFNIVHLCGHSLGGAACVFALKTNPKEIERLILISAPTIASLMLDDFLFKLNAGERSKGYVQQMIKDNFGLPLSYYFAESILPQAHFPKTLAFHDHKDTEVSFEHLNVLKHSLDNVEIVETDNLGHTKILRKDDVIEKITTFIPS